MMAGLVLYGYATDVGHSASCIVADPTASNIDFGTFEGATRAAIATHLGVGTIYRILASAKVKNRQNKLSVQLFLRSASGQELCGSRNA